MKFYIREELNYMNWKRALENVTGSKAGILTHYTIKEDLGEGKFSFVKSAECKKTGKKVAIKVLNKKEMSGVTSQLVFPSVGAGRFARSKDMDVVYGGCDALNRGMADFCSDDPRMLPVGMINLKDPEAVKVAFEQARSHSRGVLIESFIPGLDHRLLVVDGQLVAASKRVPGHIKGDGKSTVEELVDEVNSDPRRGIGHDEQCLGGVGGHRVDPGRVESVGGFVRRRIGDRGGWVGLGDGCGRVRGVG